MNVSNLSCQTRPQDVCGGRYFTLAQANHALVLVKRIVADVMRDYSRLIDLQEWIDIAHTRGAMAQCETYHSEIMAVADKLRCYAEELDSIGVILQDWSGGIVAFPCIVEGREACLSWRFGESAVEHWHDIDGAFAERRHVETMPVTQPVAAAP